MKVAVITLHAIKNYGSVLQTYATQKKFEELGCEVEIINFLREDSLDKNVYRRWTRNDKFPINVIKSLVLLPTANRWKKVFWGFLNKRVNLTPQMYLSEKEFKEHLPEADVYCTGSDQVWNSTWNRGFIPEFYLSFAPDDKMKISLSASIGKEDFEEWEKKDAYRLLKRYDAISVRESNAVSILNNIGIEDVEHLVDPTLLMTREFWTSFASKKVVKEPYVLIYQLNRNPQFDEYAVEFAKRKKCKLVRLCTRYDQIRLPGKAIVLPEVDEFVSLLANADYVITDSFHATAFSLNLNTEVVCIYPKDFSSRIASILRKTNLEHRHLLNYSQLDIADESVNFETVNNYFNAEREKADKWLRMALSLDGDKNA